MRMHAQNAAWADTVKEGIEWLWMRIARIERQWSCRVKGCGQEMDFKSLTPVVVATRVSASA